MIKVNKVFESLLDIISRSMKMFSSAKKGGEGVNSLTFEASPWKRGLLLGRKKEKKRRRSNHRLFFIMVLL